MIEMFVLVLTVVIVPVLTVLGKTLHSLIISMNIIFLEIDADI